MRIYWESVYNAADDRKYLVVVSVENYFIFGFY